MVVEGNAEEIICYLFVTFCPNIVSDTVTYNNILLILGGGGC